jgi:tetratricopeptide (TPR) repeat protein
MQGREELTLDHAIERAAAAGTLVRHEVVSVFLEVVRLAADAALVPEPSRVVLTEDGRLSFTQPPAPPSVDAAIPVRAACQLASALFRAAKLDPPLALRDGLQKAAERFPTLCHLRDAFELDLLLSGTPPPTDLERRMAIAALMAKARQLRGTSAGPPRRRREPAPDEQVAAGAPISPDAAITSPAIDLRLRAWLRPWLQRQPPRWALVAGAALAGALATMLLQRGLARQSPSPPVAVATPVEAPRSLSETRGGTAPATDARVAVHDRPAPPAKPAVRERTAAGPSAPGAEASPRPVRPLRRRVAAVTEAGAAARAKLQQGDESLRDGRFFEALVLFREALETDPSLAPAARKLGDAYRQHNDNALAIAAYERYLEMEPSAGDAEEVRSALEELRAAPIAQ